jgi:hypothetical protein
MIKSALIQNSRYGVKDRCLEFDGTNNHYVDVNFIKDHCDYDQEFTIEMWVKFDTLPTGDGQVTYSSFRDPKYISLAYASAEHSTLPAAMLGRVYLVLYKTPGLGTYPNYLVGNIPSTDTWYHYAFTSDGAGAFKLYVDGVLTDSDDLIEPDGTVGDPNILGMQIFGTTYQRRLDGLMDEFRLWNHVRTEAQIKRYMHTRLYGTETGLVAYYPMNEGTGSTAYDKSTNSNDGTITGATWIKP